ncbi:MAG: TIGR04211 family SH3 domain-containing protein [Gammaproteobacteria bacterium]
MTRTNQCVSRFFLFTTFFLSSATYAQTAYVNDQLEITLRSGESTQHSIVRMLTSGTKIEVVSRNAQSGYSQVRLEDGRTGYVLSRFLTNTPVARDRLLRAEQQLATVRSEKASQDDLLKTIREAKNDGDAQSAALGADNQRLNQELAQIRSTAADALNIDAENRTLTARLTQSEKTILELRTDNARLAARTSQWWFVLGAAAVLLGALLGFVLPRMRWRRKSRWGDL